MKMVLFNGKEIVTEDTFIVMSVNEFPLKEKDFTKNDFAYISVGETSFNHDDLFILKINAENIGSFSFVFDKNKLDNKNELYEQIKSLKKLDVSTKEDSLEKTKKLFEMVTCNNPIFFSYLGGGDFSLSEDELKNISTNLICFYLIRPIVNVIKKKINVPISVKKILENCLFAFLSAILIGLTFSLGLYNAFASNGSAVIFFICALVGAGLSSYVYLDFYRQYKFFSFPNIFNVLVSIVSIFGGVGLFYVFRMLFKDIIENEPSFYIYALSGLAIVILSIIIGLLIQKFILKNKKRKNG